MVMDLMDLMVLLNSVDFVHLMNLLYVARLRRGDLITTFTLLARRVHFWSINEDRCLKQFMRYIHRNYELSLNHQLRTEDIPGVVLDLSPDAELHGDLLTTFAFVGFWLELSSPSGSCKNQHALVLKRILSFQWVHCGL